MYFPIKIKTILPVLLIISLMFGCSANKRPSQTFPPATVPPSFKTLDNNYWWRCQLRIVWPDEISVNWGMDLLLAHSVVSPILKDHYRDISYWRFHRRAARDNTGHQFSFIFYSTSETANSVFTAINQSNILQQAIKDNLIEKVVTGDPDNPRWPNIEDTSDPNWPPDIQKNWPSFIMGVSSLWLGLIDESMQDSPDDITDINQLLTKYREVDAKITNSWRNQGQHAFLHHLNAIFGYNPLLVRKMLSF